ncbi:MAG: DUF438 domain-containing protein [Flavobacteriales bacterium]|nr:DUF438 domain-containing protein [Flavobacteriales bacterium]
MNSFFTTSEKLPTGHPIKVYQQETLLIKKLLQELNAVNPSLEFQKYYNIFNELATIEKRFARKENQLFPYLEKHGWENPSQGMWSFHDNLRTQIKILNTHNTEKNIDKIKENLPFLIGGIERLLNIEDTRLFPTALELISETEWQDFYIGDQEIGWMLKEAPVPYKGNSNNNEKKNYIHPSEDNTEGKLPFSLENTFHYDEGYMTPEQVNLLLRFLPVDITYVDENDKVIFYNRGNDRVFARSKGIIGREVRFCHPPKSVDMVLRIVKEFKAGTKDVAEFWFKYREQTIHVRYFAIRDTDKNYKGVIEMSQNITDIQKLEGEKRLLDWDS